MKFIYLGKRVLQGLFILKVNEVERNNSRKLWYKQNIFLNSLWKPRKYVTSKIQYHACVMKAFIFQHFYKPTNENSYQFKTSTAFNTSQKKMVPSFYTKELFPCCSVSVHSFYLYCPSDSLVLLFSHYWASYQNLCCPRKVY